MGRARVAAFVVLVLAISVMVTTLPPWESNADAQATCEAANDAQFRACIATYNAAAAGSTTTVDLTGDVAYTSAMTPINNGAGALLVIQGNGHALNSATFGDGITTINGDVSISHVTLTSSQQNGLLAGIFAIGGETTLENSTVTGTGYGVWAVGGDVTVRNSTIANNTAAGQNSAAVYVNDLNSSLIIEQSTIVGNAGYGLDHDFGSITISGSLVAGNNGCDGTVTAIGTGNVFDDATCGVVTPDIAGTYGSLADNPPCETGTNCTATIALNPGSPAIDANVGCNAGVDQRGVARTAGRCDAGAFEFGDITPLCAGKLVTIDMNVNGGNGTGTAGDDVILGTPGPDVIDAGAGSDTVCGEGGDDTIDGGVGDFRDFLYGGPGDDTLFGGFGIDYMYGEAGEDTLDGQGGSDRLFGGPDNDLIKGDSGADRMYGGPGDDEMRGMGGQDFMWGEEGNDLMQGNFQTDNMFGGPGNDTMFGAGGKDSLFGEAGNDALSGGNNTDYLDGGADVDTANGGRGFDKPLIAPSIRASNGQFFGGSGCIAETIVNCQPTP